MAWPGFVVRRWRGEVPLARLFWQDMLIYGTLLNIVTTIVAVGALSADAPLGVVIAAYLSPLPVNLFLTGAVWRSAEIQQSRLAGWARVGAILWLATATLI